MWKTICSFFNGLVFGSAAGYLLGVLSAPKSGEDLRAELAENSEELYKQATDSLADLSDRTGQALQEFQQKSNAVIRKASASMKEKKDRITSKLDEIAGQGTKILVEDEPGAVP